MNDNAAVTPICLTMIVRDEEKNIEKCVSSVASVVDAIAVVDTGSVDATEANIRCVAAKLGIPIYFEATGWSDDFSLHRNQSMRLAQEGAKKHVVALLLDADERVLSGIDLAVGLARGVDVVSGWLVEGDFRHKKNFLVRSSSVVTWRDARHERMEFVDGTNFLHCDQLLVSYGNDGYRRRETTTYERDLEHLEGSIGLSALDHRRLWLRARTLEASGRLREAATAYADSTRRAITVDAAFQSRWGEARSLHLTQQTALATSAYQQLVRHQPERAEGWLGLAQIAFEHDDYEASLEYASRAASCAEPSDTVMYDRAGYTWLSREIAARAHLKISEDPGTALTLLQDAAELHPASREDIDRIYQLVNELRKQLCDAKISKPNAS